MRRRPRPARWRTSPARTPASSRRRPLAAAPGTGRLGRRACTGSRDRRRRSVGGSSRPGVHRPDRPANHGSAARCRAAACGAAALDGFCDGSRRRTLRSRQGPGRRTSSGPRARRARSPIARDPVCHACQGGACRIPCTARHFRSVCRSWPRSARSTARSGSPDPARSSPQLLSRRSARQALSAGSAERCPNMVGGWGVIPVLLDDAAWERGLLLPLQATPELRTAAGAGLSLKKPSVGVNCDE